MVTAAVFTVIDTPLGWWRWFSVDDSAGVQQTVASGSESEEAIPPAVSVLPPEVTATPTPATTLGQMLAAARSVKASSERDRALRLVAETAVKENDYVLAIEAGAASPINSGRSNTLAFIARCAVKQGRFELAVDAVANIPIRSVHDSTMIEILTMKSLQEQFGVLVDNYSPIYWECD